MAQKGHEKVGEYGEFGESGESGDFGQIWSRLLTKSFKRIYQQGQKGPENVGEFGENGESDQQRYEPAPFYLLHCKLM